MKGIRRLSYVLIFIISLFVINIKISAISLEEINEEYIYENYVQKLEETYEEFDINNYSNVVCDYYISSSSSLRCKFYSIDDMDKFTYTINYTSVYFNKIEDFKYYSVNFDGTEFKPSIKSASTSAINLNNYIIFSNIYTDVITDFRSLDFSSYLSPEEEVKELEITNKATILLNFMIDKTKNIYEVLINNEIFLLCIGILISYLIFMFLLRLRK